MDENKKNQQWKKTCGQLKQAYDAWDELNRMEPTLSADEKRMLDIKNLLRDLKGKLESLSEPGPMTAIPAPAEEPHEKKSETEN